MTGRIWRRLSVVGLAAVTAVVGVVPGTTQVAQADTVAELVQTVDTSSWSPGPAAPSPAGVAYRPENRTLIVIDSDRNNLDPFDGINLWEYSLDTGLVVYSGELPTIEPTGVAYDEATDTLFVGAEDGEVLVIQPGIDLRFGTVDDVQVGIISLPGDDIEDPAFDPTSGHLFVLEGNSRQVYDVTPVNGFGGGDDTILTIGIPEDLEMELPVDWEGLAFDPVTGHLLAGAKLDQVVFEFDTSGVFVQKHDVSALGTEIFGLAGLAVQPADGSIPATYWIAERGVSQDGTPNDGALYRVTFGPAPELPPVAQNQTVNTSVGVAKAIVLTATDVNLDALTYTVTQPTHGTVSLGMTANRTYTPDPGFSGTDSFTFTAHDGAANSNVATVTVNVVNQPPSFVIPLPDILRGEGESASITTFATDPDSGQTVSYSATGLPPGLSMNSSSGVIGGTISIGATAGSPYTVTVTASDSALPPLTDTEVFVFAVTDTNRSPIMSAIGNKTVTQGSTLMFKASATDPDGDGFTFSLVSPAAEATISSAGNFTWTPSVAPGNYPVTVRVTDNGTPALTDTETITITVQAGNPNPDPVDPFIDDDGHVFENSIEWLAAEGITQGCNPPTNDRFCPNSNVTRGQMATFLVRALSLPTYSGPDRFVDDNGHIFEGAIERLAQAAITVGCNPPTNNRFCPDDNVTRGQMAAFLVRAFDLPAYSGPDRFVDDNGNVFEGAIERLAQAGITVGCNPPTNDRFCPGDNVTRGQMAAFLKRAMGG